MPRVIRNRSIVDDPYTLLRDATSLADVPDGVPVIVPLALWRARRAALIARGETGVWLAPADRPAELVDDLHRLPVIAIDFPASGDARGWAHARRLRERYRYASELRAIGALRPEGLAALTDCGVDAFALDDVADAEAALAALGHANIDRAQTGRPRAAAASTDLRCPCA